ncbi:hypothetical protein MBLNU457_7547t1 [Dothideomycetes sp. NU457]
MPGYKPDERAPLLQFPGQYGGQAREDLGDEYSQFCRLVGIKPANLPPGQKWTPTPESLWARATTRRTSQSRTYIFTATLTNGMLLSQVIFGAALTALGASNSSHTIITILGALNTIIAGLIAWLKSRGQPMRARMFRDDLNRVVDEIENSAIMWLGISRGAHGYDAIDQDEVTVRSEVARLTRHYDKAVRDNTKNDPDNYANGIPDGSYSAALRSRPGQVQPGSSAPAEPPAVAVPAVATAPDDSPATRPNKPAEQEAPKDATPPQDQTKVEDVPKEAPKDDKDKAADGSGSIPAPTATAPTPVSSPAPVPPNPGPVNTTAPASAQSQPTEEGEDDSPATALAGSKSLHKTADDKSKSDNTQRDSVMGDSGASSGSDSKK